MTALIRMRLTAYVRTGRMLAPLLAALVTLGVLYGGGGEPAGEAYGVSALVLFPVLAWQTKLLLDGEPDVQRRLALVTIGSAVREQAAGLVAATLAAVPVVALAMLAPWVLSAIAVPTRPDDVPLLSGLSVGVWAHLVVVPPAVALGALASRAVTRTFGLGATVLVAGAVLTLVLGLHGSPLWWAVPPMMAVTRQGTAGFEPVPVILVSAETAVWTAVAALGYHRIRRARA